MKKMKKLFSFIFCLALVTGVLGIVPGMYASAYADTFVPSSVVSLYEEGAAEGKDFKNVMFWPDTTITLQVNVNGTVTNASEVTWTVYKRDSSSGDFASTGNITVSGTPVLQTLDQSLSVIRQSFKISSGSVGGKYRIVASGVGGTRYYDFTVEDGNFSGLKYWDLSEDAMLNRWSGETIEMWIPYRKGTSAPNVSISSGPSYVSVESINVLKLEPKYLGKDTDIKRVKVTLGDKDTKIGKEYESVTIKATASGVNKELQMRFRQSSSFYNLLGVSCLQLTDMGIWENVHGSHDTVTHYFPNIPANGAGRLAFEMGQIVTLEFEYDSEGDIPSITLPGLGAYFTDIDPRTNDGSAFEMQCTKSPDGNGNYHCLITFYCTSKTSERDVNRITVFNHAATVANEYPVTVYQGGKFAWSPQSTYKIFITELNGKPTNGEFSGTGIQFKAGTTGTLVPEPVMYDSQEQVTWESQNPEILTINDNGEFIVPNGVNGTGKLLCKVTETRSGYRNVKVIDISVTQLNAPDSIVLLEAAANAGQAPAYNESNIAPGSITLRTGENDGLSLWIAAKPDGNNWEDYDFIVDNSGVIEVVQNGKSAKITPLKDGSCKLWVSARGTGVESEKIQFNVIQAAKTISVNVDKSEQPLMSGQTIDLIEGKKIHLDAVRDFASIGEWVEWSVPDGDKGLIKFVDEKGKETDYFEGDSCDIKIADGINVVSGKHIDITLTVTGGGKSSVKTTVPVNLVKRIPAQKIVFYHNSSATLTNTQANPLETKFEYGVFEESFTYSATDLNGIESNDSLAVKVDSSDIIGLTVEPNADKKSVKINIPYDTMGGFYTIGFYNTIDGKLLGIFYGKITIPVTELTVTCENQPIKNNDVLYSPLNSYIPLDAFMLPEYTTDKLNWTSSDPNKVRITRSDNKGARLECANLTGDSSVKITVKAESGKSVEFYVSVVKPFTSITPYFIDEDGNKLNADDQIGIKAGATYTLKVDAEPSDASDKVSVINNSNPGAFTIVESGKNTWKITANAVDSGKGTTGSIVVGPSIRGTQKGALEKTITFAVGYDDYNVNDITDYSGNSVADVNGVPKADGGLLVTGETSLYAKVYNAETYMPIKWKAIPEGVVELVSSDNGTSHTCNIKRIAAGKPVKVYAYSELDEKQGKSGVCVTINTGIDLTECSVKNVKNFTYDRAYHMNDAVDVLTPDNKLLTPNVDYYIEAPQVSDAGKYKVVVHGMGSCLGEAYGLFEIYPANLQSCKVTVNNGNSFAYTGEAVDVASQVYVVDLSGNNLTPGVDYTVSVKDNVNVGECRIEITGIGNYSGMISTTAKIEGKNIEYMSPSFSAESDCMWTGKAVTPSIIIYDGEYTLVKDGDFSVSYKNNVKPGTATAIITGKGNYSGTVSLNFEITKRYISEKDIVLSKTDYVYNKKACKPSVSVVCNGVKIPSSQYKVTYPKDMKSKGVKQITITGRKNCDGVVYANYYVAEKVTVKKATLSSVKNSAKKTATVAIKKLSGAKGYEISYSLNKKFAAKDTTVVTTTKTSYKIKKLLVGKKYYVRIRAYKLNSLGRKVYGSYSSVKNVSIKK